MARSVILGNGNMLVGLDQWANVRDFYFPMVGLENHVGEHMRHRIGVWAEGHFSWIHDGTWDMRTHTEDDALSSNVEAINIRLGVSLLFHDVVYNEKNVLVRGIEVKNLKNETQDIRIFFGHEFELYSSSTAHTAYYDPIHKALIHYKVRRAVLVNARLDGKCWSEYTTGVFGINGKQGSFKDAEDGSLSENPIEHGPADSVLGLYGSYAPGESKMLYYWVAAGKSIEKVIELNDLVLHKTPAHILQSTNNFWKSWVTKRTFHFGNLGPNNKRHFQKSLLVVRAHTNNNGAVIASSDSGMLQKGKDTYAYVWPRDAAFITLAMSGAGYLSVTREFFRFAKKTVDPKGYFMHKYNPDGSLGSSWHPWVRNGKFELPVQMDETALVLYSFWKYYEASKDLELVEESYDALIYKTAEFLTDHRDDYTGLPAPSYDLWEERFGVHTFTAASAYAGLCAAAHFAMLLGKEEERKRWSARATEIREAILKYLYNPKRGAFYRMVNIEYDCENDRCLEKPQIEYDDTIDISSAYGVYLFGVMHPDDERLQKAMEKTKEVLWCGADGGVGGLARYENDSYHRVSEKVPGNPWILTTLWYAQYRINQAKSVEDLREAADILSWANEYAEASGGLPEQLDPFTGESLSATPLTWSHAEYVRTTIAYLNKLEELGLCLDCNPNN